LRLLIAHNARFLLIGGYAVNAHGYVRNTADMDVWIASDPDNEHNVVQALREFGFPNLSDSILQEPDAMLRMGVIPLRIEVLKRISGVNFEDCWPRRVTLQDGDLTIPMIGLEDLKRNKKASGRRQDLVDLEELP
jgi:hypothetical protein